MPVYALTLSIICLCLGVFLVVIIMLQSGKSNGLSGAFGGNNDTFLAKNKAKSMDARLARLTKWIAAAFIVVTLVLCFML